MVLHPRDYCFDRRLSWRMPCAGDIVFGKPSSNFNAYFLHYDWIQLLPFRRITPLVFYNCILPITQEDKTFIIVRIRMDPRQQILWNFANDVTAHYTFTMMLGDIGITVARNAPRKGKGQPPSTKRDIARLLRCFGKEW